MRVHLRALGCRLNQAEIEQLGRELLARGHTLTEDPAAAGLQIVNSCAVTTAADADSRRLLRSLARANPQAEIAVTGCYAQLAPEVLRALPNVRHIIANTDKERLADLVTGEARAHEIEPHTRGQALPDGRTRAFVKVQDGCDHACTFCVTTIARGAGRSRALKEVLAEIRALHTAGVQEAVLTGVQLGSYGQDFGQRDGLRRLVRAVLAETDIPRLRLSSLEPWELGAEFFTLWENPRLCQHLHLPLQSGCDGTLRRMRRRTNCREFRALIAAARAAAPAMSITSDVIVGFPGESEAEFAASVDFIVEQEFAGLHVFRYSRRPGTPAARMRGQLPEPVKKARSARLRRLAEDMQANYARAQRGRTLEVLWETVAGATPAGFLNIGYTGNWLRARALHPLALVNRIMPARMGAWREGMLEAVPLPAEERMEERKGDQPRRGPS